MQHLIEHKSDKHFIDNVRLAGEWGEDDSFAITISNGLGGEAVLKPMRRIELLQYTGEHTVLRYRFTKHPEDREQIDIRRVIEVAWRPDIRRYAND